MISTVNELYMDIRKKLRDAGVTSFELEAKELICAACLINPSEFQSFLPKFLSKESYDRVDEFVKRRLDGEPCAYILGEWDFYSLTFNINKNVLIPRPDTESLVDTALSLGIIKRNNLRILDLCTGSGCIGIALAVHVPSAEVVLGDISDDALGVAKSNIEKHSLAERVTAVKCDALQKFDENLGKFDIIISNPPYIRTGDISSLDNSVRNYEPHLALDGGTDGLNYYRSICDNWKPALTEGGMLIFECGFDEAKDVADIMIKNKFERVEISKDLSGVERVVCGTSINRENLEV